MTDIRSLKNVKVPLWAQLLGYYRAKQRRKQAVNQWHYIATIFSWGSFSDTKKVFKRWYILKENEAGQRTFEFGAPYPHLKYCEDSEYARIIAPWVLGQWTNQQMRDYAPRTEKCPINDKTQ